MPNVDLPDLSLSDEDFTTIVNVRMPRALIALIAHLGRSFFDLAPNGQFFPNEKARRICSIMQEHPQRDEALVNQQADQLVEAAKAAYDQYAMMDEKDQAQDVFRPVP